VPKRLIGQTDSTGKLKKKGKRGLGSLFSSGNGDSLSAERQALVDTWAKDPWAFFTALDTTSEGSPPVIMTRDEASETAPYKPFPGERAYLRVVVQELLFGPFKGYLIDKPRQMFVSSICCLCLYWYCLFNDARNCLISKHKEELAAGFITDKIRGVHGRTPKWFQTRFPVSAEPVHRADFLASQSSITAVGQNAAVGAFRGTTASIALVDEAAFQEMLKEMVQAAAPMATRLWLVTTPNVGNPGAAEFKALLNDDSAARLMATERLQEVEVEDGESLSPGWDERD